MSNRLCTVRQHRRRREFAMQAADRDVHEDAGRMLSLAVSLNVDDCP